MKNILMISNMYPSKKYPHYGIFVQNTEDILIKNGYNVKHIVMYRKDVFLIKLINYILFYIKIILRGTFSKNTIIYGHYASHIAIPLLIIRTFRKKMKIIVNVHGNDIVPETNEDKKYIKFVRKLLIKCNNIICPSTYFKDILISEYNINDKKINIYPSGGVNTKIFKPMPKEIARQKIGLNKEKIYIGYVGRIEEKKGWDLFLKALSEIIKTNKNIYAIVVGSGSQDNEFSEMVTKYALGNVINKSNLITQEELVYVYNSIDVFVFPTYRKSESLGLVGLEAMSCKIKTVLPNKYGPYSYGKDKENSFVFNSGDAKDLKEKILEALNSNNEDILINARKTALSYDTNITESKLLTIFNKY